MADRVRKKITYKKWTNSFVTVNCDLLSPVKWFAYDFHLIREQKIVINGNSCNILYLPNANQPETVLKYCLAVVEKTVRFNTAPNRKKSMIFVV